MLEKIENLSDLYQSFQYDEVIKKSHKIMQEILLHSKEIDTFTKNNYLRCCLFLIDSLRLKGFYTEAVDVHAENYQLFFQEKSKDLRLKIDSMESAGILSNNLIQFDMLRFYIAFDMRSDEAFSLVYNHLETKFGHNYFNNLSILQIKNLKIWDLRLFTMLGFLSLTENNLEFAEETDILNNSLLKFVAFSVPFQKKADLLPMKDFILDALYFTILYHSKYQDYGEGFKYPYEEIVKGFNLDDISLNNEQQALLNFLKAVYSRKSDGKKKYLTTSLRLYQKINIDNAFSRNILILYKLYVKYIEIFEGDDEASQLFTNALKANKDNIWKEEIEETDLTEFHLVRPAIII